MEHGKAFLAKIWLPALALAAVFVLAVSIRTVFAAVSVTAAAGGGAISADTNTNNGTSSAWTILTGGPVIDENSSGDVTANNRTIVFSAPSGFTFNAAQAVTVTITKKSGSGSCFAFSSTTATPTSSSITFTVTSSDTSSATCRATFSNIQVRPTSGSLASGDILNTGTNSSIPRGSTNYGTLTEVPGVKNKLTITTQPASTATTNADFSPDPVVEVQDAYGNAVTSDSSTAVTRTAVRSSSSSCGGTAGSGTLTSTPASGAAVSSGRMTYTNMTYSAVESIKICFTATGVTSALSNAVNVILPFSKLQILLPGETAAPGTASGKTGTPTAQTSGSSFTVTVNAVDANWNVVTSAADTVRITSSDSAASMPSSASLNSGTRNFTVTLVTAGTSTLTATDTTDGTKTANTSPSVTVNPGALDHFGFAAVGTQTAGTAFNVTMTAQDVNNNTVTSYVSTADLTIDTGTISPTVSGSFASGVRTQSVTVTGAGSSVNITAKATGGTRTGTSSGFVVNPGAKSKLVVSTQPSSSGTTGVDLSTDPSVQVQDVYGNVVTTDSSTVITVAAVLSTQSCGGTAGSGAVTSTPSSGAAVSSGVMNYTTFKYSAIETVKFCFSSSGVTSALSNSVNFIGTFVKLQILLPGETAAPGTASGKTGTPTAQTSGSSFTVTVNAVDANWNVVTSAADTVRITSSDSAASMPSSASLNSGTRNFTVTLVTAGTSTLTATDTTDGTKTANTSPSVTVNPGALDHFGFAAVGTQTAGTAFNVTMTAQDVNNNTVTSYVSTADLTIDTGTISPTVSGSFASGVRTQSVTVTGAGSSVNITAKATGGTRTGTSSGFVVNPGAKSKLVVSTQPSSSGTTGVDLSTDPSVQVQDVYGNVVTTDSSTVITVAAVLSTQSCGGTAGSGAVTSTPSSGAAVSSGVMNYTTFKYSAIETVKFCFSSSGLTSALSNSVNFIGTFVKLQILLPGETAAPGTASGKTGTPSARTAGSSFTVTVNAVDANWNLMTSATDRVSISSSDANATLPSSNTLSSGTRTFTVTLATAGTSTVTATDITDTSKTPNTSSTVTVNPGSLDHFGFATIANQVVGVPFNVTMTAQDVNNNTITSYASTADLTIDTGSILPTRSGSFSSGVRTESVTVTAAGSSVHITALATGGSKTGTSAAFVVSYPATTTAALYPSSAGNFADWAPNTGTSTAAVGSADATDATYVDTSNVTLTHTFKVANAGLFAGATIGLVTLNVVARGAADGDFLQLVEEKDTTHVLADPVIRTLTTGYQTYSYAFPTKPDGSAWTVAEVNAWTTKFGVRTSAGSTARVSQIYVNVGYSVASSCKLGIDLSWNGSSATPGWSSQYSSSLSTIASTIILGGPNNLWGATHVWTTDDLSNDNFRARVSAIAPDANCRASDVIHLDWIRLKGYYTQSTDPKEASLYAADAAKLAGTSIFTIHYGNSTGRSLLAQLASGEVAVPSHQPGSTYEGSIADSGTVTAAPTSTVSGGKFSNSSNGYTSDNRYATSNKAGNQQAYTKFPIAVPPGAVIGGIEIDLVNTKTTDTTGCQVGVELSTDGGVTYTATGKKVDLTSSTGSTFIFGSTIDTWGRGWYAADLASGNFAVRLTDIHTSACTSNATLSVDQVLLKMTATSLNENSDGDNFFVAPSAADMTDIFNYIGNKVCPAAAAEAAKPPTQGTLMIISNVINVSGGTKQPGDFTATVTATGQATQSFPGQGSPGTILTLNPGPYSVTETSVDGYTEVLGADCIADASNPIVAGEIRVCVITNQDIPPPPPPPNISVTTGSWQEVPQQQ